MAKTRFRLWMTCVRDPDGGPTGSGEWCSLDPDLEGDECDDSEHELREQVAWFYEWLGDRAHAEYARWADVEDRKLLIAEDTGLVWQYELRDQNGEPDDEI